MPKRPPASPVDDWQQLELHFTDPTQRTYELIRPVVLFGQSPAERAHETTRHERTLYRQIERFARHGMAGLDPDRPLLPPHSIPLTLRHLIVTLKAEHPQFRVNELGTICYIRTGRRPDAKTIKRVLVTTPLPFPQQRWFPPFHDIPDPVDRRKAIVQLHAEGWNTKSIASYLRCSRKTVRLTLQRWIAEGVRGLANKSHARRPGVRKVDLNTLLVVRRLQQNSGLGEWRIHAALRRLGIHLSPRTCGRMLALNRDLYQIPRPNHAPPTKRTMPFAAIRRHQFWTVDIRYLDMVQLPSKEMPYCISIIDNYSRAIVASTISHTQNLSAFLMLLYVAIRQHGAPEALVSDGGAVFKAKQALEIYQRLGIVKEQIAKRQAWQSYIETTFNIQRRLADAAWRSATSWEEVMVIHEQWLADYNFQAHWAHRDRQDGRHSPAEVLGPIHGRVYLPEDLHRTFCTTRFRRVVDRAGYIRFRHWRIYGELGLARQAAVVWLYGETLTVACDTTPLAQYRVSYQPDVKQLRTIDEPHLFVTPYRSPQLSLWAFGDDAWLKVVRVPRPQVRRRRILTSTQATFDFGTL